MRAGQEERTRQVRSVRVKRTPPPFLRSLERWLRNLRAPHEANGCDAPCMYLTGGSTVQRGRASAPGRVSSPRKPDHHVEEKEQGTCTVVHASRRTACDARKPAEKHQQATGHKRSVAGLPSGFARCEACASPSLSRSALSPRSRRC